MGADGVLVFDGESQPAVVEGAQDQTFVVVEDRQDVLVFENEVSDRTLVQGDAPDEFLLFDEAPGRVSETVSSGSDLLLVEEPKPPSSMLVDGQPADFVLLTGGGPQGVHGPQGPAGAPGEGAEPDVLDLTLLFENGAT